MKMLIIVVEYAAVPQLQNTRGKVVGGGRVRQGNYPAAKIDIKLILEAVDVETGFCQRSTACSSPSRLAGPQIISACRR